MYADQTALKAILSRDPGGWETEPKDADYVAHEAWSIATFGQATWDVYSGTTWGERSDV